jgi:hypothetical protein
MTEYQQVAGEIFQTEKGFLLMLDNGLALIVHDEKQMAGYKFFPEFKDETIRQETITNMIGAEDLTAVFLESILEEPVDKFDLEYFIHNARQVVTFQISHSTLDSRDAGTEYMRATELGNKVRAGGDVHTLLREYFTATALDKDMLYKYLKREASEEARAFIDDVLTPIGEYFGGNDEQSEDTEEEKTGNSDPEPAAVS